MAQRQSVLIALMLLVGLMLPATARAEGEVTGVIGGLIGGDLDGVLAGNFSVKGSFDNGPVYGVRVGWIKPFFGFEGSYVYSPNGVDVTLQNTEIGLNGNASFLEGNFLFIPIPGPISIFGTAGLGMHTYNLDLEIPGFSARVADVQKLGYNFGGGVKINIKAVTFRGEVRDHMTRVSPGDLDLDTIAPDLFDEQWLHNVEISGGVGFRF